MCSNEALKVSIDQLKEVVEDNTAEQKETREEQEETRRALDRLTTKFETWQVTMCKEHHEKIQGIGETVANQGKSIAKVAGAVLTVTILIQLAGVLFTYLKLAPAIAGG